MPSAPIAFEALAMTVFASWATAPAGHSATLLTPSAAAAIHALLMSASAESLSLPAGYDGFAYGLYDGGRRRRPRDHRAQRQRHVVEPQRRARVVHAGQTGVDRYA